MTRITRDTVEYFPHFADASNGDTLLILQEKFGNDGYSFWFRLLEKLASTDGHWIDCRDQVKLELLYAKAHIPAEKGIILLNNLGELGAIDKELWEQKVIWCQKFVDNLEAVYKDRRRNPPEKPLIPSNKPIIRCKSEEKADNPPNNPQRERESKEREKAFFENFWKLYPKKTTKKESREYCLKMELDGDLDTRILLALEKQIKAKAMMRDSGQFTPEFPDPIRWLKKERWEDEIVGGDNQPKDKPREIPIC